MSAYGIGDRGRRVLEDLRQRILSGQLAPGVRLPSHLALAADFGVAPMTVRNVLARLESDGLVSRQPGRGTFVAAADRARVLLRARPPLSAQLIETTTAAGLAPQLAADNDAVLTALQSLQTAAMVVLQFSGSLVLQDLDLLRTLRRRWPSMPTLVIVEDLSALAPLRGTPEWPLLILSEPLRRDQLDQAFGLVLPVPGRQPDRPNSWLTFQSRLLDAIEEAVIATDPLGHILYWNRAAERLYGWRAEEVLGKNVGQVIVSQDLQEVGMEIMDRLRRGETWFGEFPMRRRDGTEVPVLVTDSPVRDDDGRLVAIIGVSTDISQQKRAELDRLALAQMETRLQQIESEFVALGQQLVLTVPRAGQLAADPKLPVHLRPIATELLDTVREFAVHFPETPR